MVFRKLFLGSFAFALLAFPTFAQETTSTIRGVVTSTTGVAVEGASVSVIHEPSGSVSSQTTNEQGIFLARNLRVGGPYVISVESAAGNSYLDSIFLELGETERLALTVGVQVEEEVVEEDGHSIEKLTEKNMLGRLAKSMDLSEDNKQKLFDYFETGELQQ